MDCALHKIKLLYEPYKVVANYAAKRGANCKLWGLPVADYADTQTNNYMYSKE